MKLNKTEQKLLSKLIENARNRFWGIPYHGTREAAAARKLEEKGLVIRRPENGWGERRLADGSYKREWTSQGNIKLLVGPPNK